MHPQPEPTARGRGSVEAGGACRSSLECKSGLFCVGLSATQPGRCGQPLADGSPCSLAIDVLAAHTGQLGAMIYGRGSDGRFILVADGDGDMWELDWPVMMVSWDCAQAYCRWKSERTGLDYRLPTEFEWEKSAKGVDGRWYVWGDGFDESYCCMADSHKGRRLPSVVDSYPIDESVYGVRGLSGNMSDWTASTWFKDWGEEEDSSTRVFRGGSWYDFARFTRAS